MMKICLVFAVFCAITALTQVTAKTLGNADSDNIDLKEELKELVEAIEMRNVAQEEQVESVGMYEPTKEKQGTSKRAYCRSTDYPEYRCASGDCIPVLYICDGDEDCPGGDDERVCRDPACDRYCPKNGGCKGWQGKCSGYCYCYGSGYAHFCDQCGA